MLKSDIESLSKSEIKNKLIEMGVSLDKIDHPKDYYVNLYLEKSKQLKISPKEKNRKNNERKKKKVKRE